MYRLSAVVVMVAAAAVAAAQTPVNETRPAKIDGVVTISNVAGSVDVVGSGESVQGSVNGGGGIAGQNGFVIYFVCVVVKFPVCVVVMLKTYRLSRHPIPQVNNSLHRSVYRHIGDRGRTRVKHETVGVHVIAVKIIR